MANIKKTKFFSLKKADAAADIGLINEYSVKELTPEDVYCFSVVLCDNEVDRDFERFTNSSLDALAPLFLGKTGISDHDWSAKKQVARLYRVETAKTEQKNSLGEDLYVLRGDAYMLNNEANKAIIDAIDGGIIKELSVGCALKKCVCSICGESLHWGICANGHQKGETYEGRLCFGELSEPVDAYEFSFVAVPAQKGAMITKTAVNEAEAKNAFAFLMQADLSVFPTEVKALLPRLQDALLADDERQKRLSVIAENKKILKG